MGAVDWTQLFAVARATPPQTVTAHTYIKKWPSASVPVLLICDDANEYVVKGPQTGRQAVNDRVVARLGRAAGAPVGDPILVNVPQDLITAEPEMAHMTAGIGHGTQFLTGCSERLAYEYATEGANPDRFATLALLFGWMHASDHQFIYENVSPHAVHSVDHGHFFPNGPNWDSASLAGAPAPAPDAAIVGGAGLSPQALDAARANFDAPTNEDIADGVGNIPPAWGLSEQDATSLAAYLATRRDIFLI
jgi:hypothetical protein